MLRPASVLGLAAFAAGLFGSALALAQGSVTVIGSTAASECHRAAKMAALTADATPCDEALGDARLLPRDRAASLVNRGIIRNHLGRLADALADFEAAMAIDPGLGEAYLNRGNTHFLARRLGDAIADYTRALELGTSDPQAAYFNRGLAHEALKDLARAEADYRQALSLAPDFDEARAKLEALGEAPAP